MMPRDEVERLVREEHAASADEETAASAREEQAREDAAERLLLSVRERTRSLTADERARAARLRGL